MKWSGKEWGRESRGKGRLLDERDENPTSGREEGRKDGRRCWQEAETAQMVLLVFPGRRSWLEY